jgi:cell division protein FtsL
MNYSKVTKMIRALLLVVTLMVAASVSAFAATATQATYSVSVDMTGSGAGFSTGDLLSNTSSFLTQYASFIVLIAAIVFARPLLNFAFFILEKVSPRYRANKRFNDMHEKIMKKMKK